MTKYNVSRHAKDGNNALRRKLGEKGYKEYMRMLGKRGLKKRYKKEKISTA